MSYCLKVKLSSLHTYPGFATKESCVTHYLTDSGVACKKATKDDAYTTQRACNALPRFGNMRK